MKRGFLKHRSIGISPSNVATSAPPPRKADTPAQLTPFHSTPDTTRVYSTNPRIVCADTRIARSPYFLYIPAAAGQAELVFIDHLEKVKQVAKWPVWGKPAPKLQNPCFRIEATPGKGVGMFATRAIKAGELVCAERPIYATRKGLAWAHDQTPANGAFPRNALRGLSDNARDALLALKNSSPPEEAIDAVLGTLFTNYLALDVTERPQPEEDFVGCFPTLSRANHSCRPTANYFFSFPTFCGQFWAVRDIAAGEEITISYAEHTDTSAARQAFLSRTFFFTCACETCSLSPTLLRESDARRDALGRLLKRLQGAPVRVPIEELEEGLRWAQSEGLPFFYAALLLHGSEGLLLHHGADLAAVWAERARDAFRVIEGGESYNVQDLDNASGMYRLMAASGIDPMQMLRLAQRSM